MAASTVEQVVRTSLARASKVVHPLKVAPVSMKNQPARNNRVSMIGLNAAHSTPAPASSGTLKILVLTYTKH